MALGILGAVLAWSFEAAYPSLLPQVLDELGQPRLYNLAFAAFEGGFGLTVPFAGWLADNRGRANLARWSCAVYLAGLLAAAAAQSMPALIAARAFQGCALGILLPITLTLVGDFSSHRWRGVVHAALGVLPAVAGLTSPLIAAATASPWAWRLLFLGASVPAAASCLLLSGAPAPSQPAPGSVARPRGRIVLLVAAALCVAISVNVGSVSPVSVALGLALLGGFAVLEWRADDPVLAPELYRRASYALSCVLELIGGVLVNTLAISLPLFLELGTGRSTVFAGTALAAAAGGYMVGHGVAGWLWSRSPPERVVQGGFVVTLLACAGVAWSVRAGPPDASWVILLFAHGAGVGMVQPTLLAQVQGAVYFSSRGKTTGTLSTFRNLGELLGDGLAGVLVAASLSAGGLPAARITSSMSRLTLATLSLAALGTLLAWIRPPMTVKQDPPPLPMRNPLR
jgi:hypothetical protein